jgi:hypothetical protein
MPVARKQELTERLQVARAKNGCSFAKRYRTADQIVRLAYHNTLIEGRDVSHERLREAARELLKEYEEGQQ